MQYETVCLVIAAKEAMDQGVPLFALTPRSQSGLSLVLIGLGSGPSAMMPPLQARGCDGEIESTALDARQKGRR